MTGITLGTENPAVLVGRKNPVMPSRRTHFVFVRDGEDHRIVGVGAFVIHCLVRLMIH